MPGAFKARARIMAARNNRPRTDADAYLMLAEMRWKGVAPNQPTPYFDVYGQVGQPMRRLL